jgi:hypothetical protein
MSEQRLRGLKIVEATTLAVLFLLLALWGTDSEHPLFLLIHTNPEILDQWYPNFGWLMPHWPHIVLPVGIGSWTLALTIRAKIPFRWILVVVGMALQLTILQFCSLQAALFAFFMWALVGYSRAFLARVTYRIVEWVGPIRSWFGSESKLPQARRVFFFIVAIGVLLRICLVFVSDNCLEDDSSVRLFYSYLLAKCYWPDHNTLYSINPIVDWLPLYYYVNAVFISVGAKLVHLRLLHAIIGISCAPILYRIAKQLGSREAAMGATVAYLFYPASMLVSTQTLSEPLFLFTVLMSVYYFQRFCLNRVYSHLILSVVGLSLGALVRYEGWTLLPVFPILYLLFVRPYRLREGLTLLIPFLVPLLMSIVVVAQGFHPLRWLLYSDYEVAKTFAELDQPSMDKIIEAYVKGWIPFSLLSLLALTVIKWGDKKVMTFVCFLVLFIAPFVYKNFTLTIWPQSRYLTNYMPLLLIPLSLVLWGVISKIFGRNPFSFFTHLLGIILLSVSGAWVGSMRIPTVPEGYAESIAFVNQLNKGQYVVSIVPHDLHLSWLIETNLLPDLDFPPDSMGTLVDFAAVRRSSSKNQRKCVFLEHEKHQKFNVEEIEYTSSENRDIYLVLFEGSGLDKFVNFRKPTEYYKSPSSDREFEFDREFEKGGFRIYHKRL